MGQNIKQSKHYLGGDSSKEASISLPLRAISSGIIGGKGAGRNSASSRLSAFFSALPYAVAVFGVAFMASCLTASIITPVQNSDAVQQVSLSFDDTGYYATVSSSGTVDINLIGTSEGAVGIVSDTVTVTTNSSTGYKLYISSDSATANSNRLNLAGNTSASYYLSPTSGTLSSPTTLDSNSWGYTTTNITGNTSTITSSSNFIGMPLLYNENLLDSYSAAVTSGRDIDVYYGVKANTALSAGIYSSRVVYTIIAEGNPAADGTVALDKDKTTLLTGGDTITISTGLYVSTDNIGTGSQAPTVTIGGDSCTSLTTSITSTGAVKFICATPAKSLVGYNDVVVNIPKYDKTYTLEDGLLYYVPWNSMTYMQDMSDYVCNTQATPDKDASSVPTKNLIDKRDNQSYRIRKLADGKCWMTEQLKIIGDSTVGYTTLTGTLSDFGDTSYTFNLPSATTSWCTESNVACSNTPNTYDNISGTATVFYNYAAATANTVELSKTNMPETDVTSSICPRNWRLPKGGSSSSTNEWSLLAKAYGGTGVSGVDADLLSRLTNVNHMHIVSTSRFYGENVNSATTRLWAGTFYAYDMVYNFDIYFGSGNIYPNGPDTARNGFGIRCIAR